MDKKIYQTIALALCDYKSTWAKKMSACDDIYGNISMQATEICHEKIEDANLALNYLNSINQTTELSTISDEFTASNMRKLLESKCNESDEVIIEELKSGIKNCVDNYSDVYLYKYGLPESVVAYLVTRGFNIEFDCKFNGKNWTKISW